MGISQAQTRKIFLARFARCIDLREPTSAQVDPCGGIGGSAPPPSARQWHFGSLKVGKNNFARGEPCTAPEAEPKNKGSPLKPQTCL